MKLFLTIWPILVAQHTLAQVTDDFSDGDFTNSPAWSGDDSKFTVDNGELRLAAPATSGSAYLSTPSEAINDAVWEFLTKLDFNPSGSNYARVYLVSDNPDLSGSLSGYYVMLGNSADEVSLYKQSGTTRTEIIDGTDGRLNLSSASIRIRVTRDSEGNWNLSSAVNDSSDYIQEGIVFDNSFKASSFFGVTCTYTSTRSTAFHFDDFSIHGNPFDDLLPPELQQMNVVSKNDLALTFSEKLDFASAETITNYFVSNGVGNPVGAELSSDLRTVTLTFNEPFPNAVSSQLTITGVMDLSHNTIIQTIKDFVFFESVKAGRKDIVITEIFADPDPVFGLPAVEYVEILNRSDSPFHLIDWELTDGSSTGKFPSVFLLPGEYMIATSDPEKFSMDAKAVLVQNFPTLNNSGDVLIIKDQEGASIDSVRYSDVWYLDDDKRPGGWSLELIDPENICSESENWIASENESGGTPGKQNSVFAQKPDLTGPRLLSSIPVSPNEIRLVFNEKLDKAIPSKEDITIKPYTPVSEILFANEALTELILKLETSLKPYILYELQVQNIYDCTGNNISEPGNMTDFGLPESPNAMDVLVNEILFNPRPTGVDFVEVVNHSNKYLNLKNWSIANIEDGKVINRKTISSVDFLLKPGGYLVFTENKNVLKGEYPAAVDKNFLAMNEMPSFNDDEGSVAILDSTGTMMDKFQYIKDIHSPFIREEEGVSLERISFDEPTQNVSNWKSASQASGFATPGYVNSNSKPDALTATGSVVIVEPEIFSPLSSHQNFVRINFQFATGGYIATIKVINPAGHVVKEITNNELVGTEGFFRWDGDTDDGMKAAVGYYMIWFEVFNEKGEVNVFKRRVAIAGQF